MVSDGIDRFRPVVGGVDVDTERPLSLGQIDDSGYLHGDFLRVGVVGREVGELLAHVIHQPGVPGVVGSRNVFVVGVAGVGEVVRAGGE